MELQDLLNTKPSAVTGELFITDGESIFGHKEVPDKKWVRCRSCHFKIAQQSDRVRINDADNQIFENPAGIFYRVVCFTQAPGSISISDYTEHNTWFPGYSWSITFCRSCNNHLGWHYRAGTEDFFGLIADRLTGI